MTLHVHDFEQGSGEWYEARRGIVTASTIKGLITAKTNTIASNVDSRALTATLVAERINGWVDDNYVSFDMARGHEVEPIARQVYSDNFAPATECGFMVRDDWGYKIGFSPDGLVGDFGLLEIKSRRPKEHLLTILANAVPAENMAQIQTGLLVSGRDWLDYVSFCAGMPLWVTRVYPDPKWRVAIIQAVKEFETAATKMIAAYNAATFDMPKTERIPELEEMRLS